jgi:hypothetical protein
LYWNIPTTATILYYNIFTDWLFCSGISLLTDYFVLEYSFRCGGAERCGHHGFDSQGHGHERAEEDGLQCLDPTRGNEGPSSGGHGREGIFIAIKLNRNKEIKMSVMWKKWVLKL